MTPTRPTPSAHRRLPGALVAAAVVLTGALTLPRRAEAAAPAIRAATPMPAAPARAPQDGRTRARLAALRSLAASPSRVPQAAQAARRAAWAAVAQREAGIGATGSWCTLHASAVAAWTGTVPNLPICGPGPAYGGTVAYVDLPGPGGGLSRYFNATPGFQCVELAERWLALYDGIAPVRANGDTVAANYHAVDPRSLLVRNGTPGAVGHAPAPGDVISFSLAPDFVDPTDGHVAIVVASRVDAAGNGRVVVAQQNVSSADYKMVLGLAHWRLFDPGEPADAALQYPYAEWFHTPVTPGPPAFPAGAMHQAVVVAQRLLVHAEPRPGGLPGVLGRTRPAL